MEEGEGSAEREVVAVGRGVRGQQGFVTGEAEGGVRREGQMRPVVLGGKLARQTMVGVAEV